MQKNNTTQAALANATSAIDASRHFPKNVFCGEWGSCFFFDSDRMFDPEFVEKIKALLEIESSMHACMSNLDKSSDEERTSFFFNREMAGQTYQAFLAGPKAGDGWIYAVDRFGCASDAGQWCMYCERRNEMAVIVFRKDCSLERYKPVIAQLKALPIKEALDLPLTYGFGHLSPEWYRDLIKHYAN